MLHFPVLVDDTRNINDILQEEEVVSVNEAIILVPSIDLMVGFAMPDALYCNVFRWGFGASIYFCHLRAKREQ